MIRVSTSLVKCCNSKTRANIIDNYYFMRLKYLFHANVSAVIESDEVFQRLYNFRKRKQNDQSDLG